MSSSAVSFSAPFVGLIIDCCGALVVLIAAAIVGAIGAILSAYAPTLTVVIVGYGVFMGMYYYYYYYYYYYVPTIGNVARIDFLYVSFRLSKGDLCVSLRLSKGIIFCTFQHPDKFFYCKILKFFTTISFYSVNIICLAFKLLRNIFKTW